MIVLGGIILAGLCFTTLLAILAPDAAAWGQERAPQPAEPMPGADCGRFDNTPSFHSLSIDKTGE